MTSPELQPAVPYGHYDASDLDTNTSTLEQLLFKDLLPELDVPQTSPECVRCGGPTSLEPAFSPVLFGCPECERMNRAQLEGFNVVVDWRSKEWDLWCERCNTWSMELPRNPTLWDLTRWAELHSMDRRHTGG
jgi:hypothetical protein